MTFRSIVVGRAGAGNVLPAVSNTELMMMAPEQIRSFPAAAGHFDNGIFSILPEKTLRFTILRDPVQRYLSTVSHMMRDPTFSHLHEQVRDLAFDDALLHPEVMAELRDMVVKLFCQVSLPTRVATMEEAETFERWRSSQVAANLGLAMEHLDSYEVVGTQEQYGDSVQLMLLRAGLPPIKATPLVNEDRSKLQSTASRATLRKVREAVALDQQLHEYAASRLRTALSETIYSLATRQYASSQPVVRRGWKFDLASLPGAYGWYEPDIDADGTRLWGGSREVQGFVLRVEPETEYAVAAKLGKLDPDKEMLVECSIAGTVVVTEPGGFVLRFRTGADDYIADVELSYGGAVSPLDAGTGTDRRKLGLVLHELAMVRVEGSEDSAPADLTTRIGALPVGEFDL